MLRSVVARQAEALCAESDRAAAGDRYRVVGGHMQEFGKFFCEQILTLSRARRMARSGSNAILARIVPVTSACDRLSQALVIGRLPVANESDLSPQR